MAANSFASPAGERLPSFQSHMEYVAPEASESALVRFRVPEFVVCVLMIGVALLFEFVPVYQRAIPGVQIKLSDTKTVWALDPTLNKDEMSQHVPMFALLLICLLVPLAVNLFVNFGLPRFRPTRIIAHDVRDFCLSMVMAIGISMLITQFLKNMTGRLRPCFYDMCGWDMDATWDGIVNLCTSTSGERDARRSFPSLHASFAWSTLFLLTLYMMGRANLNCDNRHESLFRGPQKILKMFLCWTPTLLASWIAVTRSTENLHDYADIVAGGLIGGVAASFAYGYNYGSIFGWQTSGITHHDMFEQLKPRHAPGVQFTPGAKRRNGRQSIPNNSFDSSSSFLKPSACSIVDKPQPEPFV